MGPPLDIHDPAYAEQLDRLGRKWWKRLLDVQRPYRWYLRRLQLGFVLDVGCGVGRSLANSGGHGVGVDLNKRAVELTQRRGFTAFEPDAFLQSAYAKPGTFDSMLLAHVVEHMHFAEAEALLRLYLPYLRPGGRVVLIVPQQAGFAADPTHVESFDVAALQALLRAVQVAPEHQSSFPLPQLAGRWFVHNEFVVIGRKAG